MYAVLEILGTRAGQDIFQQKWMRRSSPRWQSFLHLRRRPASLEMVMCQWPSAGLQSLWVVHLYSWLQHSISLLFAVSGSWTLPPTFCQCPSLSLTPLLKPLLDLQLQLVHRVPIYLPRWQSSETIPWSLMEMILPGKPDHSHEIAPLAKCALYTFEIWQWYCPWGHNLRDLRDIGSMGSTPSVKSKSIGGPILGYLCTCLINFVIACSPTLRPSVSIALIVDIVTGIRVRITTGISIMLSLFLPVHFPRLLIWASGFCFPPRLNAVVSIEIFHIHFVSINASKSSRISLLIEDRGRAREKRRDILSCIRTWRQKVRRTVSPFWYSSWLKTPSQVSIKHRKAKEEPSKCQNVCPIRCIGRMK